MPRTPGSLRMGLLVWALAPSEVSATPLFVGLGTLGGASSEAHGVSADGSMVVGRSDSTSQTEAFRWTLAGGMVGLGSLPGSPNDSMARAASADGSVIVGRSGTRTFRWTEAEGMLEVGDLPGGAMGGEAFGVSANGSVIVGSSSPGIDREAFRWTAVGGMTGLGGLPGATLMSEARGVSADGSIVVGLARSAAGIEAFRWTEAGGMISIGDLAGGSTNGNANAVSSDGSVIAGVSASATSQGEAFRWTQADGMVGLGDLPGGVSLSIARAVSADGSIVVGFGTSDNGFEAFIWDAVHGMRDLRAVLIADYGLDLGDWILTEATGISADGSTIVGRGTNPEGNPEGWVAILQVASGVAEIEVAPATLDFGMIDFGSSATGAVTITNIGDADLTVTSVQLSTGSDSAFGIQDALLAVPQVLSADESLDVAISFTPSSVATVAASLEVTSDDADEPVVIVDLVGQGVPFDDQAMRLLNEVFDPAVAAGTLMGSGPGNSARGRLGALRNTIEAAGHLIEAGFIDEACHQLLDAQRRTDATFPPPDFVKGPSAVELHEAIGELRVNLACTN